MAGQLLCILALSATAAFGWSSLPLRMKGHTPFVENIWINGKGPYTFLLDTGAESSSITPEAAARLGITPKYAVVLVTAAAEVPVPALVDEVRAGTLRLTGIELLQTSNAVSFDGILGQNFLSRVPLLIDLVNERLWFDPDRQLAASLIGERTSARIVDGRFLVPVRAGGKTVPLVIDSGASHLMLFDVARLSQVGTTTIQTNRGSRSVLSGRLAEVKAGAITFNDVAVGVVETPGRPERGLLPLSLFRAVYLDAERGVVMFNPELPTETMAAAR